ncbi:hypothetical protein CARUB_v10018082mg [Capsella rubella]|uniref:Cotton fiber protein n=1 Tax=Capsella rubella TaxID=81985 RepID=R0HLJ9_9BRAS|nr:uncharacterized protein LOC17887186 [Capsella rubella]EOA24803.1 hypothetical protein CARUB_v10018082mg [Capsella rubella]
MQLKSSSPSSSSSSSSPSSSMKLKTLIQNLLTHPLYRFLRALARAKSIFLEISKHNKNNNINNKKRKLMMFFPTKASKNQRKIFFGSFRLHYNWCSSHVVPVPQPFPFDVKGVEDNDSHLSGYLEWLEHKEVEDAEEISRDVGADDEEDDIDHLADMFIANCHEKFLLEKVESYRRFQEMLERGL